MWLTLALSSIFVHSMKPYAETRRGGISLGGGGRQKDSLAPTKGGAEAGGVDGG